MDALAGYGSDSDSSSENNRQTAGTLSTLLGNDSDSEDNSTGDTGVKAKEPPSKRLKVSADEDISDEKEVVPDILPPPQLYAATTDDKSFNRFRSLSLYPKDYTVELREKLSQQLKSQMDGQNEKEQQLSNKLDQMYQTFQSNSSDTVSSIAKTSSFATHLKSQHQFHNPHLLKDIISHFEIQPLQSNVGNKFAGFEYVDRLMGAEERSRIAAAALQSDGGGN